MHVLCKGKEEMKGSANIIHLVGEFISLSKILIAILLFNILFFEVKFI